MSYLQISSWIRDFSCNSSCGCGGWTAKIDLRLGAAHAPDKVAVHRGEGALTWAKTLPEGPARKAAFERLSNQWPENDAKGAAEFAKNLPSGDLRNRMFDQIANQWSWRDPKEALEFAKDMPADASSTPKKTPSDCFSVVQLIVSVLPNSLSANGLNSSWQGNSRSMSPLT